MQKYFYPIFKLPTFYERDYVKEELPLYVKWWLLGKAGRELSEILTGSEFTLLHTLNKKFKILQIKGNTMQDGEPTPENPVPIKNVTGNNNIKIQNMNLLNISSDNYIIGLNNYDNFILEDEMLKTTGNVLVGFKVKTKPNQQYTAQCFGNKAGSNSMRIREYSEEPINWNDNFIKQSTVGIKNNEITSLTITTSENTNYILYVIYADVADLIVKDMQLEQGTTATDYVPHQEQNYSLTLGDIELCKIDTAQDYFYKNNDKWYLHKEIDKVVFNGSSNVDVWGNVTQVGTSSFYRFANSAFNDTTKYKSLTPYISDKFIFDNVNSLQEKNIISNTGATGVNRLWITIDTTLMNGATVEDFKTWLSTHNTEVYYQLATPIDIEITDTTLIEQLEATLQARSYDDITYITSESDELPPLLEIQYWKERGV